jgi:peptide/nickel transport system ATP-binding protein
MLLELDGVSRVYGSRRGLFGASVPVRAVDHVSLAVAAGRTLGIVGESGCGKSTTGRLVLGLEAPSQGRVRFEGAAMPAVGSAAWRRLRARMQLVFQDPLGAMDRRLTIATQIAEPLAIHAIGDASERRDRVAALLRDVGLRPDHAARWRSTRSATPAARRSGWRWSAGDPSPPAGPGTPAACARACSWCSRTRWGRWIAG